MIHIYLSSVGIDNRNLYKISRHCFVCGMHFIEFVHGC